MSNLKLGMYCHPDAVADSPDFAKRLVGEAGVDHFILRSGYDTTTAYPDSLGKACQAVRDANASLSFMSGSFWGGTPPVDLGLPYKSNESSSPMVMPGPSTDEALVVKYQNLCKTFQPDSICVTHGRYRHPAFIDGIFDEGVTDAEYQKRMTDAGIPRSEMQTVRAAWEKAMGSLDKEALLRDSKKGLIEFLCDLSESDALKRLIAFRCDTLHSSLMKYRKVVKDNGVSFGANGYTPWGALLCGQDYEKSYAETCDFLQPLLCYMDWHRYMPLAAWCYYIRQFVSVDEKTAIEAAKSLFGLDGVVCEDSIQGLDNCLEGSTEAIYSFLTKEIQMCAPYLSKPYLFQPVLRGKDWDWAMTDKVVAEARALGIDSFVFMGCEYLMKEPPPVVKGANPFVGWN